jgi:hypothetical protein
MIDDPGKPFEFFLTYNAGDFQDACQRSGVNLINQNTRADSYGI